MAKSSTGLGFGRKCNFIPEISRSPHHFFFGFYVVVTNSLNKNKVVHFTGSEIVQWLANIISNNTKRVRTSLKHFCFFIIIFWQFHCLFWQFHCLFFLFRLPMNKKKSTSFRQNEHAYHGTYFMTFIMIQHDEQADM